METLLARIKRLVTSESGNMSIEFVIAVPLFVAVITGAVDVSRVFITQANFYGAARDTARVVARHAMDEESAEAYAAYRVSQISGAPAETDVTVRFDDEKMYAPGIGDNTRGLVTVLGVLRAMQHAGIETEADILFIGNVGEEGLGDRPPDAARGAGDQRLLAIESEIHA